MITDPDIQKLKREAMRPNYGSRYATLEQLLAVIEAYEAIKAELEAVKGKDGQQELFQEEVDCGSDHHMERGSTTGVGRVAQLAARSSARVGGEPATNKAVPHAVHRPSRDHMRVQ